MEKKRVGISVPNALPESIGDHKYNGSFSHINALLLLTRSPRTHFSEGRTTGRPAGVAMQTGGIAKGT
jgi:hypothetical protein